MKSSFKELRIDFSKCVKRDNNKYPETEINHIMEDPTNLGHNAAPLLTVEELMCVLAR
jgi:DNA polymerase-3 subunit delta'